ncbi:MAG TPA: hypothetical protein VKX17_18875 [Planctomycetota bacterium]|nr:hypothetical protein [Planctomycetota bacterium]
MKFKRYKPKTKQAILEAVKTTRSSGGKFADAFEAAKKAGYKGSSGGLYQMVYNSGSKKKRGRKKAEAKPVAEPVAAKSGSDSVVGEIGDFVKNAINAGLAAAIAALEAMKR